MRAKVTLMPFNQILLVGLGGFLGTLARFVLSRALRGFVLHPFPFSTLAINVLGSFLIGLLFAAFKDHRLFPALALFLGVGFLGGFTTFSAFSLETLELFRQQQPVLAALYVLSSVVLSLFAVWIASIVGTHITALVTN